MNFELSEHQAAFRDLIRAFGRPIAEFQAVQLKPADMANAVQAARRADLETGMARLYASEVCITASLEAMRIHCFYRDAPLMAIGEGTNDILRTVIARRLVREDQS